MRRHAKAIVAIFASLLTTFAVVGASTAAAAAPTVTIDAPSAITYTSAHITGTVNPNGGAPPETGFFAFEYMRSGGGGWNFASGRVLEGPESEATSPIAVEADLTGLVAGAEYAVRIRAYQGGENYFSAEPTFTTPAVNAPSVSLDSPSAITGTGAHFSGTIDPEAPAGNPSAADVKWRFECTPACPGLEGTIAADSASHTVGADATGLLPNTDYTVKLIAKNAGEPVTVGPESFKTLKVAPVAETLFPNPNGSQVTLRGRVNPRNSTATYQFEWGTSTAYGNVAPATPTALGFQDNTAHPISAPIAGLVAGTTYHYRLVATNTETSALAQGEDRTFTVPLAPPPPTCGNDVFRVGFGAFLPDCRAYEQVTPVDKNGLEPVATDAELGKLGSNFLVGSVDGGQVRYYVPGAIGDAEASMLLSVYQARRDGSGWKTQSTDVPQQGAPKLVPQAVVATSRDLSHTIVESRRALTPGAVAGQFNFYLRDNDTKQLEFMLTNVKQPWWAEIPGTANTGGTPDFSHILLRDRLALTPNAPDNGREKLYEFSNGQLRLVSYGPNDQPSTEYAATGMNLNDAISADGSRIFYTLGPNTLPAFSTGLYERANGHTAPVAPSQRTGEEGQVGGGLMQYLSPDGSAVYFTSMRPLTDAAGYWPGYQGGGEWLYRKENGQLTLLSPVTHDDTDLSSLLDVKVGGGGDYVYFRENNRLVAWHAGERAVIADELTPIGLLPMSASENGRYFAFSTKFTPTGYDNDNPAKCAEGCYEVYLYAADSKELECVSCRTDGVPPSGDSNFGVAEPDLSADAHPLVANDGSVYFNSRDPLVDTDVNGRPDVYQSRDGVRRLISTGTSVLPSFLGGISTDGTDVYFYTNAQLVGQDTDKLVDIYDARVDGGLASQYPPQPPAVCEGEGCRGPISSPPATGAPGTASFVGGEGGPSRTVPSRCKALATKARTATKKAKAKPRGKQRQKALKQATKLKKQASKCQAEAR